MHGYNMQIISTWRNPSKRPFTKEEFMKLDENHSIVRYVKVTKIINYLIFLRMLRNFDDLDT